MRKQPRSRTFAPEKRLGCSASPLTFRDQLNLFFLGEVLRTVFIAATNKKCKNHSGNPSQKREHEDNQHRGTSSVCDGQRREYYAEKIPQDCNESISVCRFLFVRVAHRDILSSLTISDIYVQNREKTIPVDNLLPKNQKIKPGNSSRAFFSSLFPLHCIELQPTSPHCFAFPARLSVSSVHVRSSPKSWAELPSPGKSRLRCTSRAGALLRPSSFAALLLFPPDSRMAFSM